ncbi:MAG TPA: alpha/beta hydrolase, partial [Acidobacteria bacterium]|nr:alpha/beta hydrolase [Acidobacteriota bacterium]
VEIFFEDRGAGQPVLLIHGHTLDHRVFDEVVAALEGEELRLLGPDLRGHGRSSVPPSGYHWSHHAADMATVLETAGASRATVVGFSLGGGVALELALERPGLVGGLVLVDAVLPDRPFEHEFLANLKEVARTVRSEGVRAAMEGPWAASPLFAPSLAKPGVRDRLEAILRDFPGADYLARERDRVERDWTVPERLGEITVPATVLVGERDMPGFVAYSREIAGGIPGAQLETVPGCGHLVPLEAPETVARAIVATVRAAGAGGGPGS